MVNATEHTHGRNAPQGDGLRMAQPEQEWQVLWIAPELPVATAYRS